MATPRKPPEEHKPDGRPTKFDAKVMLPQAEKLCNLGATDAELADFFGVSIPTVMLWMVEHPKFSEVVTRSKVAFDARIERSMAQRAIGYNYTSEKVFNHNGKIIRAKTVEHVPADPGAAMNWLKNRKRDEWRDGFVHQHELPTMAEVKEQMGSVEDEI